MFCPLGAVKGGKPIFTFSEFKKTKPQLGERQEKKKFTEGTIFLLHCVIALLTFCSIIWVFQSVLVLILHLIQGEWPLTSFLYTSLNEEFQLWSR